MRCSRDGREGEGGSRARAGADLWRGSDSRGWREEGSRHHAAVTPAPSGLARRTGGFGSRLMGHLKEHALSLGVLHLLTRAQRPGHRALAEWRGRDTPGTRPVGMPTTRPPASSSGTVSTPRPRAAWTSTASTGPSRTTLAHSCGRPCSTPTARRSLRMSIRTRSRRGGAGSHRPRRLAPKPRLLPRDRARQAGPTSRLRESGVSQVIGAILHDCVLSLSLSVSLSSDQACGLWPPRRSHWRGVFVCFLSKNCSSQKKRNK